MVCEARDNSERRRPAVRLSLESAVDRGAIEGANRWSFHPRSCPKDDGTRRIKIEGRSGLKTLTAQLTAGEAAELMLELGSALEQAARDQRRAPDNSPRLEVLSGGRA